MSISTQFLHTIQPVSEDRPAEAVAREILALIRSEYRYTIADLCRMFCCERQWIEDFFVPNIRHIHVNHFFMSYITQQFAGRITPEEQSHLIHGHYFLSDVDLGRFWRENASAAVKCRTVDLSDYLADGRSRKALSVEKRATRLQSEQRGKGSVTMQKCAVCLPVKDIRFTCIGRSSRGSFGSRSRCRNCLPELSAVWFPPRSISDGTASRQTALPENG
ncbi:MAG: hypothetical protein ACLU38_10735 [Dysosmobacter sp.]